MLKTQPLDEVLANFRATHPVAEIRCGGETWRYHRGTAESNSALGVRWVWWGLLVVALLGLWYIPFGTLINGTIILLLIVSAQRSV